MNNVVTIEPNDVMIVHTRKELAAALASLADDSRKDVLIEWHRPGGGITRYRMKPDNVSKFDPYFRSRHYEKLGKLARRIPTESCK